ncbi:LytR/AlgR family response regulator transcription factor [Filimonas effusa]|uniref:LytTR family transcriptional regulator n=1 Tax=Filimonas effusa TaxID=2508721 RepID=A0A4Q1D1S7_9BACT|nr:LytTR family DNA-binding domain-containing protein [Filimonas effusa]RXK81744.1 LytTR family transcriptional regulator [Filimonas effusa]
MPLNHLFIFHQDGYLNIEISRISHIEGGDVYSTVHLDNCKHLVKMPLYLIAESLKANGFYRIHTSYIVPLQRIVSINSDVTDIKGVGNLPVSKKYFRLLLSEVRTIHTSKGSQG